MSERGLPPDGAPACPFVAFEDDRDGRATAPDHRHRCFAEPRPAPRALAHQEAYCLSSAFPVCPTFQDWARREAAAARPAPAAQAVHDEEPESHPMPPLEHEQHPSSVPPAIPPRRNPPRDWAAPPPWTGESPDGLAGAPDRTGPDDVASYGSYPRDEPGPAAPADVPAIPQPREPAPAGWGAESRGLAGSAAYRLAGPDPDEPYPAAPAPGDPYEYPPVAARRNPEPDPARQAPANRPPSARPPAGSPQATPLESASQASSPGRRQDAAELFGPAWERPRKYEAYPTLRTRIGLPSIGGIPKLGMAALALVLAAMVLFFFGPMILGFGKNDPGTGGTPTATPSAGATETPAPTEPPAPTPQLYTVKQGDTISKIAKKFNVTVEALLAANPQIKNPDKIKIGDKITIPLEVEGASEEP